jgi:hypothetical protein
MPKGQYYKKRHSCSQRDPAIGGSQSHLFDTIYYRPHPANADKARLLLSFDVGASKIHPGNIQYKINGEGKMARKGIQKEDIITIDGFLEEVELEDGDRGLVVYDGENDYLVVMDKKGQKLSNHVDEEVEVSGTLSEKDGELWLKVTFFQLIEDFEDMYDDDGYYPDYDDRRSA